MSVPRRIFLGTAFTAAVAGAGYHLFGKITTPDARTQKTRPLPRRDLLLGFFANHKTSSDHLDCLESVLNQRIDLSLRFTSLRDLEFPLEEARLMAKRGGSLYLKFKITESDVLRFSLKKHSKALKGFAKVCEEYAGPIFIEPYFSLRAAALSSPKKQEVLNAIFEHLSKAPNITWVGSPALGSLPHDWASINCTQSFENGGWATFEKEFNVQISALSADRPAILFVASSAPRAERSSFIFQALQTATTDPRIKGIVFYHAPTIQAAQTFSNSLDANTLQSMRDQMAREHVLFRSDIHGNLETRPLPIADPKRCSKVLRRFFTPRQAALRKELTERIKELHNKIEEFSGGSQEVPLRTALAQAYVELSSLERRNKDIVPYIEKALEALIVPFQKYQSLSRSGKRPDRFPVVYNYFEIKLQLAALYSLTGRSYEAQKLRYETLAELDKERLLVEMQIDEYSTKGYQTRAYLELASTYEQLGKLGKAISLYEKVDSWATREQNKSLLVLFWKGENRSKLRYVAARARLGLASVAIKQNRGINKALDGLKDLLKWEETGREEGFMDLGFTALIYLMRAYLMDSSPARARWRFNREINWHTINKRRDFKKTLDIKDVNLASDKTDKWAEVLDALRSYDLPDNLKTEIAVINELSRYKGVSHE